MVGIPLKQTLWYDPKVLEESLGTGFWSTVTFHELTGSVTGSANQSSGGATFVFFGINWPVLRQKKKLQMWLSLSENPCRESQDRFSNCVHFKDNQTD